MASNVVNSRQLNKYLEPLGFMTCNNVLGLSTEDTRMLNPWACCHDSVSGVAFLVGSQ
jgi:hypothetical protein